MDNPPVSVTLREFVDADLDALFEWEREPEAVRMAAFTRADPSDRAAFDAHYRRVRSDPADTLLAVAAGRVLVGTVSSFTIEGHREVGYWIDPARWGEGIGSAALRELLRIETTRPLFGRVAEHNIGSARVLTRAGFEQVGTEPAYAAGIGREVVEHVYRLSAVRV
jgi:RimJ/RimL family protein N-acetyltransferase